MVYFKKAEFDQMTDFMEDLARELGFEFTRYQKSYREGMQDLVASRRSKVGRRFKIAS